MAFYIEKKDDMQNLLNKTEEILVNYGMKWNKKKTKAMSSNKLDNKWLNININREH